MEHLAPKALTVLLLVSVAVILIDRSGTGCLTALVAALGRGYFWWANR